MRLPRFIACCTSLALLAPAPPLRAQATPDTTLVGTWAGGTTQLPGIAGALALVRAGSAWRATVGRHALACEARQGEVRCETRGDSGALRVPLPVRDRAYWVQPPLNGPAYATPVRLHRAGAGSWRGDVVPLAERVTLHLRIWRDGSGRVLARFRNPEFGWQLGRTFEVASSDRAVEFRDPVSGAVRFRQDLDRTQGTITFDFGTPFTLHRVTGPAPARGPLRTPQARNDGWRTASLASMGFDAAKVEAIVRDLETADAFGDSTVLVHALLVARHGRLVLERYAPGFDAEQLHDTRSAAKTLTSVLAGVAMRRGAPLTLDGSVRAALDSAHVARDDASGRITLRHLLTHTTGLACDDDDSDSPGNEERLQQQRDEPDWARYTLALAAVHPPGAHYAYCSATMHTAAALVEHATGAWLPAFFDSTLARPLGMGRWAWNLTPTGSGYGGGGVYLRPRDFARLGQLYLDGGSWRGARIVDRAWVDTSVAPQATMENGGSDGLAWHRYRVVAGGREWEEFEASGNGGQFTMVVPELELVVTAMAGNYGRYGTWRRIREDLLPQLIGAIAPATSGRGQLRPRVPGPVPHPGHGG